MYNKKEHFIVSHKENRNGRNVVVGRFYCILNGKWYNTLGGLRNAIRPFKITTKQYYDEYYISSDEGKCKVCQQQTNFADVLRGYNLFCSDICANKDEQKRETIRNKFEDKETLASFRKKKIDWRKSKSNEYFDEMHKKRVNTLLKNNGEDYFLNLGKLGNQKLQELLKANPELKQKMVTKMLDTKRKNGTFVNGMSGLIKEMTYQGKVYRYQGYEDMVIKFLIDNNILFYNSNMVPPVNFDCMSGKYMADFYLPEYNFLIDVKSERTFTIKQNTLLLKQQSAIEQNYNFCYFVISSKKVNKNRVLSEEDNRVFKEYLNKLISSQSLKEAGSTTIPNGSTLQAIGSGSARGPLKMDRDIV